MADELGSIVLRNLFALNRHSDVIQWEYFREGVEIYRLFTDESGCSTALLKYEPGTSVPAHEHTGYEHILILEGDQSDEQQQYRRGDLLISRPGSTHSIRSTTGCIVLAIWEKPVRFIGG
jgi:predicted ChrR family anti-sigma factor